jgi:shikimate kinase
MSGHGLAHGAATVVNAIAAGRGAAFGVDLRTEATVELKGDDVISVIEGHGGEPHDLMRLCVLRVMEEFSYEGGAVVTTRSQIPISRGLKSSSAAANAVIAATLDALGERMDSLDAIRVGCACAIEAKVSITGAFDDACASALGGLVLTDNRANELLMRSLMPEELRVIIHVPERQIRKSEVPVSRVRLLRQEAEMSFALAMEGNWTRAMLLNGIVQCSALGLDPAPALRALELGALTAGLSGTGPAMVAVADAALAGTIAQEWGGECIIAGIFNGDE